MYVCMYVCMNMVKSRCGTARWWLKLNGRLRSMDGAHPIELVVGASLNGFASPQEARGLDHFGGLAWIDWTCDS